MVKAVRPIFYADARLRRVAIRNGLTIKFAFGYATLRLTFRPHGIHAGTLLIIDHHLCQLNRPSQVAATS
jgi:hypothetical protein